MKIGLIIIEPLRLMTEEFLHKLIEEESPYHMCFVKNKNNSRDLFKFLEKKAREDEKGLSVIHNLNKNLHSVKAAFRYLESRNDIEDIIILENNNESLINDFDSFFNSIEIPH